MRFLTFALCTLLATVSSVSATTYDYFVSGATNNFANYQLSTAGGAAQANPTININAGDILNFRLNQTNNDVFVVHPFGLSKTIANTDFESGLGEVTSTCENSGVPNSAKPSAGDCYVRLTAPNSTSAATYYYKCGVHGAMKGTINVAAAAPSTTAPPSTVSPNTTVAPNSTVAPNTTSVPTTTPLPTQTPTNRTNTTTAPTTTAPTNVTATTAPPTNTNTTNSPTTSTPTTPAPLNNGTKNDAIITTVSSFSTSIMAAVVAVVAAIARA